MGGESADHSHGDHLPTASIADHQQRFANGGDDAGMRLERRIRKTQNAIAERGIGGNELIDLAQIGGGMMECGKQLEVSEVVLGDGVGAEEHGQRKEIALKESAALRDGNAQLDIGFNFLGEETSAAVSCHGIDCASEIEVRSTGSQS